MSVSRTVMGSVPLVIVYGMVSAAEGTTTLVEVVVSTEKVVVVVPTTTKLTLMIVVVVVTLWLVKLVEVLKRRMVWTVVKLRERTTVSVIVLVTEIKVFELTTV